MSGSEHSDRWSELTALVDRLLDAPSDQKGALIQQLSAGDPTRRRELEALLVECEQEPSLLSGPAAVRFAALLDDERRFPDALLDRYRLTGELGRGGMATVYLARDEKHGRDVAVKVIDPALAATLGADRFLREIEIVAQLRHPHIVPLYDSGEANGALYFVMPYESGLSLRQRMAAHPPLAVDEVIGILRDVCDALGHAHSHGIVHRDIKPDNVLLAGRHALVTDFGVAKAAAEPRNGDRREGATAILGTPVYMAPEQIAGDPHSDHRADLYAVGVLAYELLAGRPPFSGGSHHEILSAHLTAAPPWLAEYRADVPAPLVELVMKCLEKRPADRWQHADELVRRLEAVAMAAKDASWRSRWASARIERLTDFPGSEVDAAISGDGQVVAFLADRANVFDAFVTRVESGEFSNLTNGRFHQLYNEDVRNIGFSADASHVWIRAADIASLPSVSIIPTLGGEPRPFLSTAVMAVWSPDGSRLAYHEATPGDPICVADGDGGNARTIFIASPGVHCHFLNWSPDGRFLYFSHGIPPDEMDIWRIPSAGGSARRITKHNSRVAHPVLLDDRTLIYTATDDDGRGPWLYVTDVEECIPQRLSAGVEHYISIAASAEVPGRPRRLVATVSNPSVNLWSVPITSGVIDESAAGRVSLPTARSAAPRFGPDASIVYLASRGGADGLWCLSGGSARELRKPTEGAVVGAAAVSPDGKSVCFPVRRHGRSTLYRADADGAGPHTIAESLDVRGAATWSPDGRWLAVTAKVDEGLRTFKIPAAGGAPVRLVDSVSSNPVWSPDGSVILYSGTPRARSTPLQAVTPQGEPVPVPPLMVDRVGDSYRFLPGGRQLVVKLGGFRRQDFWLLDLDTGDLRQLTSLTPGASVPRFDVSPDGERIVFERVRENSDVVLIELPRPRS